MALRDTWHRALVYFGLAEDPDYHEPDLYEPETGTHGAATTTYERSRRAATVSRLGDRRRCQDEIDDIFADDEPGAARARRCARSATAAAPTCACTSSTRTASTTPRRSPTASSRACR